MMRAFARPFAASRAFFGQPRPRLALPTPPPPAGAILLDFASATLDGGSDIVSVPNAGGEAAVYGDASDVSGAIPGGSGAGQWANGQFSTSVGMSGSHVLRNDVLPDATNPGGAPGEYTVEGIAGFTGTGLDRIDGGLYAGAWVAGNHGSAHQDLVSSTDYPAEPGVVILSADGSTVLAEFPNGGTTTQGVAYSAVDDTIWVASGGSGIAQYHQNGTLLQFVSVGDFGIVNGVVYVDDTGELLCGSQAGNGKLAVIDAATGAVKTTTLPHPAGWPTAWDQGAFDATTGILYVTSGGNGYPATVDRIRLDLSGPTLAFSGLSMRPWKWREVTAPEGLFVDAAKGIVYALSDDGFHPSAANDQNRIVAYRLPSLSAPSTLVIGMAGSITADGGRKMLACSGDGGYSAMTFYMLKEADSSLRMYLKDALSGAVVDADWTAANVAAMTSSMMIVIDVDAQTAELVIDGVPQGDGAVTFQPVEPINMPPLRIGSNDTVKCPEMSWRRVAVGTDPNEVQAWLEAA